MLAIADVGPIGWTFIVWFACALLLFVLDRFFAAADNGGIWKSDDPIVSVLTYLVLLLVGPIIVVGLVLWIAWELIIGYWRGSSVQSPRKEQSRPESEDTVLVDLVRRRAAVDPRLNGAEIGQWPMCQFWTTPESMILDLVAKYHQLRAAGAAEDLIWDKLETYRADFGTSELPDPCSLIDFVAHRLALEHPRYSEFGSSFLLSQIERCEHFVRKDIQSTTESKGWPPPEWLIKQTRLPSFPMRKPQLDATQRGDAIRQLRAYKSRQEIKTLEVLMLPGDEIWEFSSPPELWHKLMGRAGIALVRDGRSIACVVTTMN
jgi:hypothetical protein